MSNEQKLREFSEWLDTYRDLPVHEVFHEIVLRYEEALATTEPAVNQQLTTAPFDEREAFEKWLGIKPCGAAHDFGWSAWQARAALREALSELLRIVSIHQNATRNNFAWAEVAFAREVLATTEPEPFDEREAFEKWLGIKPCGAAHDFGWSAWQARAALREKESNK